MNAIDLLKQQHQDVRNLFDQIDKAPEDARQDLFDQIADALTAHTAIEERHFYPAMMSGETDEMVRTSLEEHLSVKRILADMLELSPDEEDFWAKCQVLKEQVEHHVQEEEEQLLPKASTLYAPEVLDALGETMEADYTLMVSEEPRLDIAGQTGQAAPMDQSNVGKV